MLFLLLFRVRCVIAWIASPPRRCQYRGPSVKPRALESNQGPGVLTSRSVGTLIQGSTLSPFTGVVRKHMVVVGFSEISCFVILSANSSHVIGGGNFCQEYYTIMNPIFIEKEDFSHEIVTILSYRYNGNL